VADKLNNNLLYSFADALGLAVTYDAKSGKIGGDGFREVTFGGVEVPFSFKIVSSALLGREYLILVKVCGNLSFLMIAGVLDRLELHMLNQAKMDSPFGWLEKHKPKDGADAVRLLQTATVKSFVKVEKNRWEIAA